VAVANTLQLEITRRHASRSALFWLISYCACAQTPSSQLPTKFWHRHWIQRHRFLTREQKGGDWPFSRRDLDLWHFTLNVRSTSRVT